MTLFAQTSFHELDSTQNYLERPKNSRSHFGKLLCTSEDVCRRSASRTPNDIKIYTRASKIVPCIRQSLAVHEGTEASHFYTRTHVSLHSFHRWLGMQSMKAIFHTVALLRSPVARIEPFGELVRSRAMEGHRSQGGEHVVEYVKAGIMREYVHGGGIVRTKCVPAQQ